MEIIIFSVRVYGFIKTIVAIKNIIDGTNRSPADFWESVRKGIINTRYIRVILHIRE